jgi:hypothetical protein
MADIERLLAAYAWADTSQDARLSALSITVVRPEPADLLARLAPRPDWLRELTVDEALEVDRDEIGWQWNLVQVDALDGVTVLIEPNGWSTAAPTVLARLSRGGRAANVFWNVNADMSFGYAVDGSIVRTFDPVLYDAGDPPLPEEASLPFATGDSPSAAALTMLTQLMEVEIDLSWPLEPRRPTYLVPIPSGPN